ncbi:hypothetical protein [Escherichia albertii]|nr:hypothetical protein [Escherichia albertii]EFO0323497.1 hypothetical protein [Escherichia albertii]MCI5279728.1 hypothetical protein [Escherichia albertii]MCZ8868165.1 hypothetical protein [Escherichia albertii]MCZ9150501.1 hypothetical protein [Escherichia albertii]WDC01202.1 hypothetical protein PS046_18330 [Escherichia albertii]
MAWTESGAAQEEWHSNIMQIGVRYDPGILVVTKGKEMAGVVTPDIPEWKNLNEMQIREIPEINFRAAIIYLMNSLSIVSLRSVKKPCIAPLSVTISRKEKINTLNDIVNKKNTTIDVLYEMNNIPAYLHEGDVFKYVPAVEKRVIVGWNLPINAQRIALAYNGGGDPKYIEKIKYTHSLIMSIPR